MPARIDITGHRSGRLVALKPTNKRSSCGHIYWRCLCDCGKVVNMQGKHLRIQKSCGCARIKDLSGQRFGRLVALKPTAQRAGSNVIWKCQCDCGNISFVDSKSMRQGDSKSCGCFHDAARWVRNTNIDPIDVPFEVTDIMKTRRKIRKFIKQAS